MPQGGRGDQELAEEHEHIIKRYASMHDDEVQKADRMCDIIDLPKPAMEAWMCEQIMAVADPPYMRQVRELFDDSTAGQGPGRLLLSGVATIGHDRDQTATVSRGRIAGGLSSLSTLGKFAYA